jgi:hypothetical protein
LHEVVPSLERVKKFEIFDDDVILTGFMCSGTTLIANLLWILLNNFDFDKASNLVLDGRVPAIE